MNTEIITIGDEILIGQIVDTNSAYLATELNKLGISVVQITSVSDTRESILKALEDAGTRAELIIITGGLGPTSDDITKPALSEFFSTNLVEDAGVLERITALLAKRGVALNERNRKQAELPANCEVLPNSAGTAQGMWFTRNGRHYISLPGVPFEMKAIYTEEMEPRFRNRFHLPHIIHTTILTTGVPESEMANRISQWEAQLPPDLKLAYLPSPGILRLRITGKSNGDRIVLENLVKSEKHKLEAIAGPDIFGYDNDTLESVVGRIMKENHLTLSLAESCTGGNISTLITSVPGSSAYYKGGTVAYSNEIKTSELNVSPYTLIINGAVSQEVAEQMADGSRTRFSSDFALAVTGIAGPDGGSPEKPVGTTWIAVASKKRIVSHCYHFGDNRGRNIQRASVSGLFMLLKEIKNCL